MNTDNEQKRNKIIISPSYGGFLFAIQHFDIDDLSILTDHRELTVFLEKTGVQIIPVKKLNGVRLRDFLKYKFYLWWFSGKIKGTDVYFTFRFSALFFLYLAYRLKKKNNLFFCDLDYPHPVFTPGRELSRAEKTALRMNALYRRVLGLPVTVFKPANREDIFLVQGITRKQMTKDFQVINKAPKKDVFVANAKKIQQRLSVEGADIIYVDNAITWFPEAEEAIVSILKNLQALGYSIKIKPHPGFALSEKLKQYDQIDKQIPAEILFEYANIAVVGFYSAAINFLADYIPVFSVVEFVQDKAWKSHIIHDYLNKNIQLPKTQEAFVKNIEALVK